MLASNVYFLMFEYIPGINNIVPIDLCLDFGFGLLDFGSLVRFGRP